MEDEGGDPRAHLPLTADDERLWVYPAAGGGPSTWTLRDLGGKVLREYKNTAGTWSVNRDYVYGKGQLLGAAVSPTVNHYFHVDHLGTPRLITGADKKRVVYHAYYPFGQEATSPTLDTERMKFTGHERDLNAVTGTNPAADDLDYMHARFYNPGVGRFLSVDPGKDWEMRHPQSWNAYAYVRNNPMNSVDPDGRFTIFPVPLVTEFAYTPPVAPGGFIYEALPQRGQAILDGINAVVDSLNDFMSIPGVAMVGPAGGGRGFTGGTSRTIENLQIGRGRVRVDQEVPTGQSKGNVHVQYKGPGGAKKIFLDSPADISNLPKKWQKNEKLRKAIEKAFELLDRFVPE